jgi:methylenetetrahydrofolate reductase (NADPH)
VLSVSRLHRVVELSGETIPPALLRDLEAADDAEAAAQVGIDHATRLARALLDGGASGIHLYTFNRSRAPLAVLEGAGLIQTRTPA